MIRTVQNSFVAGEIDPVLFGRQDFKKYFEGAATLRNFYVQRHGGITKRSGTDLLAALTTVAGWGTYSAGCKLVPFLYDRSLSFLLVLVDKAAYVFKNGVQVLSGGNPYSIVTPYGYADLAGVRYTQSGDTLFLTHPDYRPATLVRYADVDWRYTVQTFAPSSAPPASLTHGNNCNGSTNQETIPANKAYITYGYGVSAIVAGQETKISNEISVTILSPWLAGFAIMLSWAKVLGAEGYRVYKKASGCFGYIGSTRSTLKNTTSASTASFAGSTALVTSPAYFNNDVNELTDGTIDQTSGIEDHHASYCIFHNPTYPNTAEVRFDLGSAKSVAAVKLGLGAIVRSTDDNVSTINSNISTLQVWSSSANGSADSGWTLRATATSMPNGVTDGLTTVAFTAISAQYWKFKVTARYSSTSNIALREVQWCNAAGTVQSSGVTPAVYAPTAVASGYAINSLACLTDGLVDDMTTLLSNFHQSYCVFQATSPELPQVQLSFSGAKTFAGVNIAVGAYVINSTKTATSTVKGNIKVVEVLGSATGNETDWVRVALASLPDGVVAGTAALSWDDVTWQYWLLRVLEVYTPDAPCCLREVQWVERAHDVTFTDDNILQDGADTPNEPEDPFKATSGFPRVMTLFQQRSVWAGSTIAPSRLAFSSVGDLYSFNKSLPLKPSDMIDVRLPLTKPGAVLHMVPMRSLLLLTEGGEWVVSFDEKSGLGFDTIRMAQNSYYGCADVVPLAIGNSCLFVLRGARSLAEYQYQLASDGFMAADRSIFSAHLTASAKIIAMAHQQQPDSLIWCALSDGALLSMTYVPEQEIWAWARHDLAGGKVLDVVSTGSLVQTSAGADTTTDEVYLLVERGTSLFLERMRVVSASDTPALGDAVCLDAAQRVTLGSAGKTLTPAVALPAGTYTVVDLETGVRQVGTASGATVTVPANITRAMIGVAITSTLDTLRPELVQQSIQGYRKTVKKAILRLRRSSGGTVQPLTDTQTALAIRDGAATVTAGSGADGTIVLLTGDRSLPITGCWNKDGQMRVLHADVWPFSILSLMLDVDMEGIS